MSTHTHDEIAQLAYRLWMERGCPQGSPELDWERARELLESSQDGNEVLRVPAPTAAHAGNAASRRRRKGQPTHLS